MRYNSFRACAAWCGHQVPPGPESKEVRIVSREGQREPASPPPLPARVRRPGEVYMDLSGVREDDATTDATELSLQPLDADTERARQLIRESDLTAPGRLPAAITEPPRWQFTLRHLLLVNLAIAVALALLQALAPSLIAGTVGLIALAAFSGVMIYQPARPELYAVAWSSIVLYIVMSIVALARQ